MDLQNALKIYTVYKHPVDYPDKYVVRVFWNDVPEQEPLCVVDTLEEAREHIPWGCYWMPAQPGDAKVILETYF